jgi:hypothetical protein
VNQAFPASLLVKGTGVRQVFDKGAPTKPLKTACMILVSSDRGIDPRRNPSKLANAPQLVTWDK